MPNKKQTDYNNSCVTPIYQNTVYFFENTEQVIQYHENEINVGRYGRYDNPNWLEVEKKIATLDNYQDALIFSSGMNAIVTTILTFVQPKDRLIYTGKCYRNVRNFFKSVLPKLAIEVIPMDSADTQRFHAEFEAQYQENTKIVFIEAPSNPHLYLVDLERLKSQIGQNTLLIVDSTLATPFNCKPQHFGADLVIHSCSKYLGGHGDILAGSVSGSIELIEEIRNYRNMMGGVVAPHGAFLLNRSLESFEIRMKHFNQAGMEVAQYLQNSPLVEKVFYTGLDSHPHVALAQKYLTGHGGVVSFEIKANRESTSRFVDALTVPFMGSNFGSNHPMVEQCSIFTYYKLSAQERQQLGITDNLVRLSVGYGDTGMLIEDINRALNDTCRV